MGKVVACVMGDLSLVRCLGRQGIPVAVVTEYVTGSVVRSRYVHEVLAWPAGISDEEMVRRMCDFASRFDSPPVLFYQGDDDLLLVSRARRELAHHYRMVLPPAELVEQFVDKVRFAELAARRGLPTPRTIILRRGAPIPGEMLQWDDFPAVLKPSSRHGWFGSSLHEKQLGTNQKAIRVESREQLEQLLPALREHHTDFLLQHAVPGGEECILSYHAYFRPNGEVAAEFTGRKVRTYPRTYGLSTHLEVTDDPEIKAVGRRLLEQLGFSGVVKIDMKKDPVTGRLHLLEVNPRFTLWNHPGALAGVDIPKLVYDDLVTQTGGHAGPARPGVRWMVTRADFRAFMQYRAAGEASLGRWLWQTVTADVHEDFHWRDPLPAVVDLWDMVRRRVRGSTGSRPAKAGA